MWRGRKGELAKGGLRSQKKGTDRRERIDSRGQKVSGGREVGGRAKGGREYR